MALPTVAHSEGWEYAGTIYGWVPGMDASLETRFGDLEASPSGGDIISSLDMVFMGTFEASNGSWGVMTDILYVDLSENKNTPFGVLFADGKVDLEMSAISGYLTYNIMETSNAVYTLAGGFRYFDVDSTATLRAGLLPAESATLKDSWIDPIIGVRGNWKLSEKWSATGFVDFGGLVGSSETWQVVATANYDFNENWQARFGYRYMDISQTIRGRDLDIGLSGPVVSIAYRF
jgi:hypothetical protein